MARVALGALMCVFALGACSSESNEARAKKRAKARRIVNELAGAYFHRAEKQGYCPEDLSAFTEIVDLDVKQALRKGNEDPWGHPYAFKCPGGDIKVFGV